MNPQPPVFSRSLDALRNGQPLKPALKADLEALPSGLLPLQQALRQGSVALYQDLHPVVLSVDSGPDTHELVCTLFFSSLVAGCQCADDPSPEERLAESARLRILIDARDASAEIRLID